MSQTETAATAQIEDRLGLNSTQKGMFRLLSAISLHEQMQQRTLDGTSSIDFINWDDTTDKPLKTSDILEAVINRSAKDKLPIPQDGRFVSFSWHVGKPYPGPSDRYADEAEFREELPLRGCRDIRIVCDLAQKGGTDGRDKQWHALNIVVVDGGGGRLERIRENLEQVANTVDYPLQIIDRSGVYRYRNHKYEQKTTDHNIRTNKSLVDLDPKNGPKLAAEVRGLMRQLDTMTVAQIQALLDPKRDEKDWLKFLKSLEGVGLLESLNKTGQILNKFKKLPYEAFIEYASEIGCYPRERNQLLSQIRYLSLNRQELTRLYVIASTLDENKRRKRGAVISASLGVGVGLGASLGYYDDIQRVKDMLLQPPPPAITAPLPTSTQKAPRPTTRPTETQRPQKTEPTTTLSPEDQAKLDEINRLRKLDQDAVALWEPIYQKYKEKYGFDVRETRVVDRSEFPSDEVYEEFTKDMLEFLKKVQEKRGGDANIDFIYPVVGKDPITGEKTYSQFYLDVESADGLIRVTFYGDNTVPSQVANVIYYDPQKGECGTVAQAPLLNGTWQQNRINFDPKNPQTCVAITSTTADYVVAVVFVPGADGIQVYTAYFNRLKP